MITRRTLIRSAAASLLCAPAIVRAASLMAVKPLPETLYYQGIPLVFDYQQIAHTLTFGGEAPEAIWINEADWDALLADQDRRDARIKRDLEMNLFSDAYA